jgi:MbtH protein
MSSEPDVTIYTVLVNQEYQYALWPKHKAVPPGWEAAGKEGSREECSRYVDEVWADVPVPRASH